MADYRDRAVAEWMAGPSSTDGPDTALFEIERENIMNDIVGRIDLGLYKIEDLLSELLPYINKDAADLEGVAKALGFLDRALKRVQPEALRRHDVEYLVNIGCARLSACDEYNYSAGIYEVASCLKTLIKMKMFLKYNAVPIAESIFAVNTLELFNKLPASTRLALYDIFANLFDTQQETLAKDMGASFVKAFVGLAEKEKDPSCLKIVFAIYKDTSSDKWALPVDSLKMSWDSFIRYYPITVGGKRSDISKPNPEVLKELLLQCLLSSNHYAEWTFPYLIEMLDTVVSANIKKEVLLTLMSCVSSYNADTVFEWSSKTWDALKFEIINGNNDEFIQLSLNVIRGIANTLSQESSTSDRSLLEKYVISVAKECNERFRDQTQQFTNACGRIISAIAISPDAFRLVAKVTLPILLAMQQDLDSPSRKESLLRSLNMILEARLSLDDNDDMIKDLAAYQQGLVDTYFYAMTEQLLDPSYRIVTIQGLALLYRIPKFLRDMERGTIIEQLNLAVLHVQDEKVSLQAISALQQISIEDPDKFRDITLVNFLERLPSSISLDEKKQKVEISTLIGTLEALTQIACTALCKIEFRTGALSYPDTSFKFRLFDEFSKSLLSKLSTRDPNGETIFKDKGQLIYAKLILATMYSGLLLFNQALQREAAAADALCGSESTHPFFFYVQQLFRLCVAPKFHSNDPLAAAGLPFMGLTELDSQHTHPDDGFLKLVGSYATVALRSPVTTHENNFLFSSEALNPRDPSEIWTLFYPDIPQSGIEVSQQNLQFGPADKCSVNILSMHLMAGIRREDKKRLKIRVGDVAASMIRNAVSVDNNCSPEARLSMLQFLQLCVNKFGATKEPLDHGDKKLVDIMRELVETSSTRSDFEANHIYQTLAYFTAAALLTFDSSTPDLVNMMLGGLAIPRRGRRVAQSFRILLSTSEILNSENFCVLRPLAKGRLYELAVARIATQLQETQDRMLKDNCLIALTAILTHMSLSILKPRAESILPLLLEGTNVQDDDLTKVSCIEIINMLIPHLPSAIEERIDSVINRMTDRTHNTFDSPSDASVQCRAKALDCLSLLAQHVNPAVLLKRKNRVVGELDFALDDCSREVRHRAEQCKLMWFNLSAEQDHTGHDHE